MNQKVILYSTHCPKCSVLAAKLKQKNIPFEERTDITEMKSLGLQSAPALMVNDRLMNFSTAIKWVNEQEA